MQWATRAMFTALRWQRADMLIDRVEASTKNCLLPPTMAGGVTKCVSSQCMAWRYGAESGRGYCGLAGRPLVVDLLHMKRAIAEVVPFAKEVAKL
jgi:hypothetical protein